MEFNLTGMSCVERSRRGLHRTSAKSLGGWGVEDAVTFYKIYAIACGFDVRRYTTKKWRGGEIKSKLFVCNREGFAHKTPSKDRDGGLVGEKSQRIFRVTRVGCKARIRLYMKNGHLLIDRFHEDHNHELISLKDREFQKLSRNITDYHKMIIVSNSRLKIGATKTYRICKEQVNGFENIGASLNDFKNFHRDVKCFIHERDDQLFVDQFKEMTETRIGFYFDYDVDDDGSLRRAIWADGTARDNYKIFGDAVSFDPTYSTNKYSMVFTPFTGVDHHKRSVTFCGALIAREDYESFNWVFSRFLQAMGGMEPEYIITDQDPGIIKSVPSKFGVSRSDYNDFMCKINDIIWDDELEAAEFDGIWEQIIEDHGVGVNDWFVDTYAIRGQWVMAHCRDLRMASIMRTTQRSESENSFFKRFEHKSGTLVEFWMRFESAMDQQRHTQKQLDNMDKHSSAAASTHLALEIHAAKVYTYSAFQKFKQEGIFSIDTCRTGGFTERCELEVTTVKDSSRKKNFEVAYNPGTRKASCSYTMFERTGILCRHIIWIFSASGIKTIPEDYVVNRRMKEYLRLRIFNTNGEGTENMQVIDEKQIAMSIMWSEVHEAVGLLRDKGVADVDSFSAVIRAFKQSLSPLGEVLNKNQQMEKFLNCTACDVVTILPPKNSKNKGTGKRLLSAKTKAMVLARKPKRKYKNCKRMTNHDKRNCPNPSQHTRHCAKGRLNQKRMKERRRKSWNQNKNRRQITNKCCSIYFECVT
ncbi:protein FAR1-RELATED SEQUENCE 9-like [Silene latifolia]|uniref:protein FAR1-RELATED SEQUENCE 9-like n=1 Tax=Silene latifolia TaxID=37657 RepID=UPI003D76A602